MKRINFLFLSICSILAVSITTSSIYSQQDSKAQDAGEKKESKDKLVGTYLDISHARERARETQDKIRDDIYYLQVVVANFGDENDKNKLKAIVTDHTNGKKEFFKRKFLSADQIFQKVRSDVRELYTQLADKYQKKANDILSLCAETIVDKEIGIGSTREAITSETASRTSKKITQNRIKLVIGYDHLNMGDKFKTDSMLSDALTHYRLAKLHGIGILVDLAETQEEKNKIQSQYKVDLADSETQISK